MSHVATSAQLAIDFGLSNQITKCGISHMHILASAPPDTNWEFHDHFAATSYVCVARPLWLEGKYLFIQ